MKGLNYMRSSQRSQYTEYHGKQNRFESAGFRQPLVGAAGNYGHPVDHANMYDDYSPQESSYSTRYLVLQDPGEPFGDLDNSSPENTSIYNSDGVQAFATGAFAPGVTLRMPRIRCRQLTTELNGTGLRSTGNTSCAG